MKYRIDVLHKKNREYDKESIASLKPSISDQLNKLFVLVDKNGKLYKDENGCVPVYVSPSTGGRKYSQIPSDANAFFAHYAKENNVKLKMGYRDADFLISCGDIDNDACWDGTKGIVLFNINEHYKRLCAELDCNFEHALIDDNKEKGQSYIKTLEILMRKSDVLEKISIQKDSEKTVGKTFYASNGIQLNYEENDREL